MYLFLFIIARPHAESISLDIFDISGRFVQEMVSRTYSTAPLFTALFVSWTVFMLVNLSFSLSTVPVSWTLRRSICSKSQNLSTIIWLRLENPHIFIEPSLISFLLRFCHCWCILRLKHIASADNFVQLMFHNWTVSVAGFVLAMAVVTFVVFSCCVAVFCFMICTCALTTDWMF